MGLCNTRGLIARDNADLIPSGVIPESVLEFLPNGEPTEAEREVLTLLPNRSIVNITQPDGTVEWFVKIKQQPSRSLRVEIIFMTVLKSGNETIADQAGSGAFVLLGSGAGIIAGIVAATTVLGGISFGTTRLSMQIIESETKYDIPIRITEEILSQGYVDLKNKYPMTVFGIFKEKICDEENIQVTPEQKLVAGVSIPGTGFVLPPSSSPLGQFKGDLVDDAFGTIENLLDISIFDGIVSDDRRLLYRADSQSFGNMRHGFTYNSSHDFVDATSTKMKIRTEGLKKDDVIYFTGLLGTKRHLRQNMEHKARVFEGANGVGQFTLAEIIAIGSIDAMNFKPCSWRIKKFTGSGFPEFPDITKDVDDVRVSIANAFLNQPEDDNEKIWEYIDGWRLSEVASAEEMFGMDRRGIWRADVRGNVTILLAANSIRDQAWFNQYLVDNGIENRDIKITGQDTVGAMLDMSEVTLSVLTDQEKIVYHRPFALALSKVSAFDSTDATKGVGIKLLDFVENGLDVGDLEQFDLSLVEFKPSDQASYSSEAYNSQTCQAGRDSSVRDGDGNINIIGLFGSPPPPDIQTDWLISTPTFRGRFGKTSRIWMERFNPDLFNRKVLQFNFILVEAFPFSQASLSLDLTPNRDYAYAAFENVDNGSLSYYKLENGILQNELVDLALLPSGNNERPEFDHESFRVIGYSLAAGQLPSYSEGRTASIEGLEICNGNSKRSEVYRDDVWDVTFDGQVYEASNERNLLFRDIVINYSVNASELRREVGVSGNLEESKNIFNDAIKDVDRYLSIQFESSNKVIDNIIVPLEFDDLGSEGVDKKLIIDGHLYGGDAMKIRGEMLKSVVNIKSVSTVSIEESNSTDFLIAGTQTATAVDGLNKVMIFYNDNESDNISVAVSSDSGANWYLNRDIIRLLDGETADLPFVISDKPSNIVHLFYRLNNEYLMCKVINTNLFTCLDSGVVYEPPVKFDAESDDDLGIEGYSDQGKELRKIPSVFVIAQSDQFLTDEKNITLSRSSTSLQTVTSPDGTTTTTAEKSTRFIFPVDRDDPKSFEDANYTVYRDNRGSFIVFAIFENGRLWVRSGSGSTWPNAFLAQDAVVHKNFKDDNIDGKDLTISNPQVVYDHESDTLHFLYFHQDALFVRVLRNSYLKPISTQVTVDGENVLAFVSVEGEGGGLFISENVREELEVREDSPTVPYFLVGDMPPEIQTAIENDDSNLLAVIRVPDGIDREQFVDGFSIDTSAKPTGYTAANGTIRFFYKNADGLAYGMSFNEGEALTPKLDVQRRKAT